MSLELSHCCFGSLMAVLLVAFVPPLVHSESIELGNEAACLVRDEARERIEVSDGSAHGCFRCYCVVGYAEDDAWFRGRGLVEK